MANTNCALSRETIDDTFRRLGLLDEDARNRVAALGRHTDAKPGEQYRFAIADNTWSKEPKQEDSDA